MSKLKTDQAHNFVRVVNEQVSLLAHLSHIPLGGEYSALSFEEARNNLILHRISSKFETPSQGNETKRKQETLKNAFDYDKLGLLSFNPAKMSLKEDVRKLLYETRALLHNICNLYVFNVGCVEITTGETFVSARGDTSIYAKLRDIKQWCVTPSCFDLFATIVYRTNYLKKVAKKHIADRDVEHLNRFLLSCRKAGKNEYAARKYFKFRKNKKLFMDYMAEGALSSVPHDIGFKIFKKQLKEIVTFVGGARFTTVAKNNTTDRVIECEAMCNMIVQRVIANGIKEAISRRFNVDLRDAQDFHRKMILDNSYATIDLKNASNSNWIAVVNWLIGGTRLFKHVFQSRSSHIQIDDGWECLNMVAPMGNGFTFELMTMILLCFTRSLDNTSRVFGDDIIIKSDKAQPLIDVLQVMGWQINSNKTFIHGNFRESCGAFVSQSKYIVSYDMPYSSDIVDAITTTNKLRILSLNCEGDLAERLRRAYHCCVDACPASLVQEGKDNNSLGPFVYANKQYVRRLHKNDELVTKLRSSLRRDINNTVKSLHYKPSDLTIGIVCKKESTSYKTTPRDKVRNMCYIAYYLYTNSVTLPKIRRNIITYETVVVVNGYML